MTRLIMGLQASAIAVTAVLCLGLTPAMAQLKPALLVEECAPPGGVWGPGNTTRAKIQKFADKTAVYLSQPFASTDPNHWSHSPVLPWSGGNFVSAIGITDTVIPEGDGYRVAAPKYFAHFSCKPVVGATGK